MISNVRIAEVALWSTQRCWKMTSQSLTQAAVSGRLQEPTSAAVGLLRSDATLPKMRAKAERPGCTALAPTPAGPDWRSALTIHAASTCKTRETASHPRSSSRCGTGIHLRFEHRYEIAIVSTRNTADGKTRPPWQGQTALRCSRAPPSWLLPEVAGARPHALSFPWRVQHGSPDRRGQSSCVGRHARRAAEVA
jgi:hypothetical protein